MYSPSEAQFVRQLTYGVDSIYFSMDIDSSTDPVATYPSPNLQYHAISIAPDSDIDLAAFSYPDFFGGSSVERISPKVPYIGRVRKPTLITDPTLTPNLRFWRNSSIKTWFETTDGIYSLPSLNLLYHPRPPIGTLQSKRVPKFYYGSFTFDAGTGTTYTLARIPTFGRTYVSFWMIQTSGFTITPTLNGIIFNPTATSTFDVITINKCGGASMVSGTSTVPSQTWRGISIGNNASTNAQVNRGWYADALSLTAVKTTAGVTSIDFFIEVADHVESP